MTTKIIKLNGSSYNATTGSKVAAKSAKKVVAQPNHTSHRAPQSSTTLMRRAVKKPTKKPITVTTAALAHPTTITVKQSVHTIQKDRLTRAKAIPHHEQVTKYSSVNHSVPVRFSHVPVTPAPTAGQAPVAPPPLTPFAPANELFERAVAHANHYVDFRGQRTAFRKKARLHAAGMTAGVLAILMLTAFATYLNNPNLQFTVAGIRAGVDTTMPNFAAANMAYDGATTARGARTIHLSHNGSRYYLSQRSTNWSDREMIQSVAAKNLSGEQNYQKDSVGNQTVYRMNNGSTLWVKNGVWYTLNGDKQLSDSELGALVQNV